MIEWAYGVTTCTQRLDGLLPDTLASLARAGFDQPRLFIDGQGVSPYCLPVTRRDPPVGAYGSWLLAIWELYLRQPQANLYAIFQDDMRMCLGVKEYLERTDYQDRSYLNLLTSGPNEHRVFGKPNGWHRSDQLGRGAVALVFNHDAVVTLLQQTHTVHKPQLPNGRKNLDGAIQHALVAQAKFTEYVHNPSLVQHVGRDSTLGNRQHPDAKTFPGEAFDARSLLL